MQNEVPLSIVPEETRDNRSKSIPQVQSGALRRTP
jgi:hypothetical protein